MRRVAFGSMPCAPAWSIHQWEGEWGLTPSRRSCAISQSPGWAVPTRSPRRFSGSAVLAPASCSAWPCRLTAALQLTEAPPSALNSAVQKADYTCNGADVDDVTGPLLAHNRQRGAHRVRPTEFRNAL